MVAHSEMYQNRNTYGSSTMAAQRPSFRSDTFGSGMNLPESSAQSFGLSRPAERNGSNRSGDAHKPSLAPSISDPSTFSNELRPAPAIVIRRLPRNIRGDAVNSMLLFAEDMIETEFVHSPYPDDHGFATVVARFRSQAGAHEAQQKLHGKPNMTRDTNMIVEIHSSGMMGSMERRATIDGLTSRAQTGSASSSSSNGAGPPPPSGRSRFGSTFQSTDKISPPLPTPSSAGSGRDFPVSDSNHIQNLFSPQSPLTNNGFDDRNRISGKSFINGDGADDETRELLKDPVAYAKLGQQSRRATNPSITGLSKFGSLSLSTPSGNGSINNLVSASSSITSPRGNAAITSPLSPTNITNMGPNGFVSNNPRTFPPVNPADQNPPCNTLYVGNLPIDTSEDELKAIFSKQRGYKRLCFRTKQNGPMCFVEFEDISFATKALNELYGHPLHNSIKGGIRLSFSKNPLGVRSGQGNGMMPNSAYLQNPMASAYSNGNGNPSNFTAVSGPPPGLSSPPGLINGQTNGYRSPQPTQNGMEGMFSTPFGMSSQNFHDQLGPRTLSGGIPPNMSAQYGRDSRGSYTDYMLGR